MNNDAFEKRNENIDRYLANEMTPNEKSVFEAEMASDQKLQDTINIRREMGAFFNKGGDELLEKLKTAGDKQFASQTTAANSGWKWVFMVLAIFLTAMAIYWFSKPEQNDIIPAEKENPVIAPTTVTTDSQAVEKDSVQLTPIEKPKVENANPEKRPAPRKEREAIPPAVPIAQINPADFAPNPYLEEMIHDQLRSSITLDVDAPQPGDTMFLDVNDKGLLLAGSINQEIAINYVLYDNKEDSFLSENPLAKGQVKAAAADENYTFYRRVKAVFKPGRYYLMLLNSTGEEVLDARTFIIMP